MHILNTLEGAGYEARLVGGCVRDTLMRRRPSDWDVATAARPGEVERLFRRTVPTGARHGTVTVLYGGGHCEVTTYRTEGAYTDRRRPDSVSFTTSLEADLSRRDFTINAMAMDAAGRVTDPFGGRADLARGLIRCVGEPERRFGEDALRLLRCLRFASRLGFEIDAATLAALRSLAPLTASLSAERVAGEVSAMLSSPRPDGAYLLADWGLLSGRAAPGSGPPARPLAPLPHYARLAHYCASLEERGSIMSTRGFLTALRFPARSIKTASAAAEIILGQKRDYKRLLRDYGEDAVLAALPKSRALRAVLACGECWSVKGLAVGGAELAALGLRGREIGEALDALLEHVIDHPSDNRHDILCQLIKERYGNDRA